MGVRFFTITLGLGVGNGGRGMAFFLGGGVINKITLLSLANNKVLSSNPASLRRLSATSGAEVNLYLECYTQESARPEVFSGLAGQLHC